MAVQLSPVFLAEREIIVSVSFFCTIYITINCVHYIYIEAERDTHRNQANTETERDTHQKQANT